MELWGRMLRSCQSRLPAASVTVGRPVKSALQQYFVSSPFDEILWIVYTLRCRLSGARVRGLIVIAPVIEWRKTWKYCLVVDPEPITEHPRKSLLLYALQV